MMATVKEKRCTFLLKFSVILRTLCKKMFFWWQLTISTNLFLEALGMKPLQTKPKTIHQHPLILYLM